jgi:hypothetical protein
MAACNDPFSNEQLPPVTQTGENTFGFKLDGEVWLPYLEGFDFAGRRALTANYTQQLSLFTLIARKYDDSEEVDEYLSISIDSLSILNIDNSFVKHIRYRNSNNENVQVYQMGAIQNDNFISITKLDPTNHIISGTFEFTLNDGNQDIRITEGRFDFIYPFQRESVLS